MYKTKAEVVTQILSDLSITCSGEAPEANDLASGCEMLEIELESLKHNNLFPHPIDEIPTYLVSSIKHYVEHKFSKKYLGDSIDRQIEQIQKNEAIEQIRKHVYQHETSDKQHYKPYL